MTGESTGADDATGDGGAPVTLTVDHDGETTVLSVTPGTNLRRALLDAGRSPYTSVTERVNCGGRGLCATCGVRVLTPRAPEHWHDRLAARFGYPRLSCQLTVEHDTHVRIPEKLVWGDRAHDPRE
ncbi:2Fe-2S iron-sulfur cluster-binding protein [Halomarina oriensis]|uniref:2Fe-2S iron-sulfur cluster binding domain-containing protein n=1 Tax=Halomarina oriensis TaxID=671145 RepID=A0A6B0GM11_9EURY|nr:2Fe-2S iron-sulfur cluster-binding protein [Halomarina oriensis]MWG35764.1 2Fe-2S iron-sulfur cluster binding domain-containing protein [Halomarina oriensis]